MFGREFAQLGEWTVLAIPTSRWAIAWRSQPSRPRGCLVVSVWLIARGLGVGLMVGLTWWSTGLAIHAVGTKCLSLLAC